MPSRTQSQIESVQFPLFEIPSDWKMPTELPTLRGRSKWIGVDCETKDPYLTEKGPGFPRKDARIIGVSVSAEGGFKRYYPVGHAQGPNLAPNVVFRWLSDQLGGDELKIGCNLGYDLEALAYSDVRVRGSLYDVSIVDALIDENQMVYDLEHVAQRRLGRGKNEELLNDAARLHLIDKKKDMWKLTARYVGPYAEDDADLPYHIMESQRKEIADQDLQRVVDVENELLHVLLEMRLRGVRVDLEKAHVNRKKLLELGGEIDQKIYDLVGEAVDANDTKHLATVYEKMGVFVPRTVHMNLSITKDWLEAQGDEFSLLVRRARQIEVTRRNNIDYDIIRDSIGDRIYARFNSVKGEYGDGTETGRFSSSSPNLQKIPHRDEELSVLVRECYVPEEGEVWLKSDMSQQEPRWLLHLAKKRRLPGCDEFIAKMTADPKLKFYTLVTEIVNRVSGRSFMYKTIKDMTLGLMYGMGIKKLAGKLGIPIDEAKEIVRCYHEAVPFAKEIAEQCMNSAQERGYVRTFLGRRRHFDKWELASRARQKDYVFSKSLPLEEAQKMWPGKQLQRSMVHKSLNGAIQGSSADQVKLAMLMLWKEHKKTMSIPVHDELSGSCKDLEEARIVKYCMENAVKLVLPAIADAGVGPDWAHATQPV